MTRIYFFRLSKVWNMLHDGSVTSSLKMLLNVFMYFFFDFFVVVVVLSFSFLFLIKYQISATENHKRELVVSNCVERYSQTSL